jgi:glycosyltransferase involved in cell wall biosynthesis
LKILFTGVVLEPSWPGGEPRVARMVENIFSSHDIQVIKCFFPRNRPRKWSPINPWASQTILNHKVVSAYRHYIDKVKPDIVMTWHDYDLSAFWASVLSGVPTIAQAQVLWPVCPLSSLFSEINESPCNGPSKLCGLCLAKRAKYIGETRYSTPPVAFLPFTQLSMMKIKNIKSKLSHASSIVSDSLFLKKMMACNGYDISKVHVIHNAVNFNPIKPTFSLNKQKIVLFLSNQINRQKGVYHFMQLSKNLKPEFPDVRFLWVGQTTVHGKTFENHSYIWNNQELQDMFKSSYLLLLPSLWPEPMSYSVIEAMAHGKPVVAYNTGANSEAIVHGKTGLLAEWGNIDQLTSHVRTLLLNESLAVQMGRNGRARAEELFSMEHMVDNYMKLIRETQIVRA